MRILSILFLLLVTSSLQANGEVCKNIFSGAAELKPLSDLQLQMLEWEVRRVFVKYEKLKEEKDENLYPAAYREVEGFDKIHPDKRIQFDIAHMYAAEVTRMGLSEKIMTEYTGSKPVIGLERTRGYPVIETLDVADRPLLRFTEKILIQYFESRQNAMVVDPRQVKALMTAKNFIKDMVAMIELNEVAMLERIRYYTEAPQVGDGTARVLLILDILQIMELKHPGISKSALTKLENVVNASENISTVYPMIVEKMEELKAKKKEP